MSALPSIADVLDAAADLIEPKGAWCDDFAQDKNGNPLRYGSDPDAVCWCALGAVEHATGRALGCPPEVQALYYRAETLLDKMTPRGILQFNRYNPQASVVAKVRQCAVLARASGL